MNKRNQPAAKHPIQIAAAYTGLSTDRIRAWEKRYHAVTPARDNNGHRLYSRDDIKRLNLLKQATSVGRRISEVVKLSTPDLIKMIDQDSIAIAKAATAEHTRPSTDAVMEYFDLCIDAIVSLDAKQLFSSIHEAAKNLGHIFLLEDMLLPLMNHVHEECRRGEMKNTQASFLREVLHSMLLQLCASPKKTHLPQHKVVVCSLESDIKLFALRSAVVVAIIGWQPVYIGTEVPVSEVHNAVKASDARAVIVGFSDISNSFQTPNKLRLLTDLLKNEASLFANVPLYYSYAYEITELGIIQTNNLSDLSKHLTKLQTEQTS